MCFGRKEEESEQLVSPLQKHIIRNSIKRIKNRIRYSQEIKFTYFFPFTMMVLGRERGGIVIVTPSPLPSPPFPSLSPTSSNSYFSRDHLTTAARDIFGHSFVSKNFSHHKFKKKKKKITTIAEKGACPCVKSKND